MRALNRVAKWRLVYAGWQLGTRPKGDPEADAVRDAAEARILLRVEASALAALLIHKGVFTDTEWTEQLIAEAEALNERMENSFPGITATDTGLVFTAGAKETMRGWKP